MSRVRGRLRSQERAAWPKAPSQSLEGLASDGLGRRARRRRSSSGRSACRSRPERDRPSPSCRSDKRRIFGCVHRTLSDGAHHVAPVLAKRCQNFAISDTTPTALRGFAKAFTGSYTKRLTTRGEPHHCWPAEVKFNCRSGRSPSSPSDAIGVSGPESGTRESEPLPARTRARARTRKKEVSRVPPPPRMRSEVSGPESGTLTSLPSLRSMQRRATGLLRYGWMLWFRWKTLSGSYCRLTSRSRS
jgi:hypothetical protein